MDGTPPTGSRREPAPSPDVTALTGNTLAGAGAIVIAVAVLSHGLAVPFIVGAGVLASTTGLAIPWIPVLRRPKRHRGDSK